jgi:hypothetical protein
MSARDRARFEAIRARWVKACDAERAYRLDVLLSRYAKTNPSSSWLNATERRRLEAFRRAQDRASDAMFELLDRIGGRYWRSLIPHHWVMEELSYEDATTRGALSVVPPCGYGTSAREVERFAAAIDNAERI